MTKIYKAIYELDDNNWWFVRIPEIPGCHSHGRNIPAARRNIFEAAALCLDVEEDTLSIKDDVRLPGELKKVVKLAQVRREQAEKSKESAQLATADALSKLKNSGLNLSVRDLADLVGVSHARVQQLLETQSNKKVAS